MVITTAPTWRQVKHLLWREIHSRLRTARMKLPGKILLTRIDAGGNSFAMGFAADRGVQFQGFHCENLLIIIDEANGIGDDIWDAAEGVAVGGNNKILAIGNPLHASGRFYKIFKSAGWRKITISALQHPNVVRRGPRIPGCVTAEFVEEKVGEWCVEDQGVQVFRCAGVQEGSPTGVFRPEYLNTRTPEYPNEHPNTRIPECQTPTVFLWRGRHYRPNDLFRARILGEFPLADENSLIPLGWIEAGMKMAAVDVARYGGDNTVIGMRTGMVAKIVQVIEGSDLMTVVGAIKNLAYAEHPANIAVDAIGEGAGVVDRLFELGIDGVQPVKGSERAFNPDLYANRRAEMYWGLRERFRSGEISLRGSQLSIANCRANCKNAFSGEK